MNVTFCTAFFLCIQINLSIAKGANKQGQNRANNVQYTTVNTSSQYRVPYTSHRTSRLTNWVLDLLNSFRNNSFVRRVFSRLLPKRDVFPTEGCTAVFGKGWEDPPERIEIFFEKNDFSSCLKENYDAGNCLFYSIAFFLRNVHREGVKDIPNIQYDAPDNLKNRIRKIMQTHCKTISILCLRALAAIDFIGFDYENEDALKEFELFPLIDKLIVYKQAYVGLTTDTVNAESILKKISENPRSKQPYAQLFRELTTCRNPMHWGNESDIASLERIFNFKTIIFNDQGSAFTVPSDVDNPYNIFVLYFAAAHYNPISFYQIFKLCDKTIEKKIYYFTSEDLPEFLKKILQGEQRVYS